MVFLYLSSRFTFNDSSMFRVATSDDGKSLKSAVQSSEKMVTNELIFGYYARIYNVAALPATLGLYSRLFVQMAYLPKSPNPRNSVQIVVPICIS
jgi:hypothetical protein